MPEDIKNFHITTLEQLDQQLKKIDEIYALNGTVIVKKPGQWGIHLGKVKSRPAPTEAEIKWRKKFQDKIEIK